MKYYNPKWVAYLALLVATINSFGWPLYGLIFTKILYVLLQPELTDFWKQIDFWCGMFLVLAFGIAVFGTLQKYIFVYVGENLTFTVRKELYTAILYKQISWFDNKERAPGILSNVLSEDIACLNGLSTETISTLLEAMGS